MINGQLRCLLVFGLSLNQRLQTEDISGIRFPEMMCRGFERQGYAANAFQLESLILAQNERWRQA